jgi:hypothetical protein
MCYWQNTKNLLLIPTFFFISEDNQTESLFKTDLGVMVDDIA